MAKNEDGELEYILGNRQLISVFLIVVILLGVFFSMGYIVGRNSAAAPSDSVRDSKAASAHGPQASDTPGKSSEATSTEPAATAPESSTAREGTAKAASAETVNPTPSTAPAASPVPAATSTAKSAHAVTAPVTPTPAPPAPAATKEEKPGAFGTQRTASVTSDLAPGDYWQVVATARPDAEIVTEALSRKGFHAVLAPAPKQGVFRVLVGPLRDSATQSQTRTSLEAAGFKNPIIRKY